MKGTGQPTLSTSSWPSKQPSKEATVSATNSTTYSLADVFTKFAESPRVMLATTVWRKAPDKFLELLIKDQERMQDVLAAIVVARALIDSELAGYMEADGIVFSCVLPVQLYGPGSPEKLFYVMVDFARADDGPRFEVFANEAEAKSRAFVVAPTSGSN